MTNLLGKLFPGLGARLPVADLLPAPTPLRRHEITFGDSSITIWIKHDETSGLLYGGNKVRKLTYILGRAQSRGAEAIATFGAVGSHHALATALYARALGFEAIAFLGHQSSTDHVIDALSAHVANGTRIVRYGGDRRRRIATLRQALAGRRAWVIPAGGSSWLGTTGFVDAALELAADIEAGNIDYPRRLYVANGTMGTVAGLGLGLALAGLDIEIQAVRITSESIASRSGTLKLMQKTAGMLHRIDPTFPAGLAERANIRFRDEFVGEGYTRATPASDFALKVAADELALTLETTYTAKAFAALLTDARDDSVRMDGQLFWNTYSAVGLPQQAELTLADTGLPDDFKRYFA